jgi:hypothetical protein
MDLKTFVAETLTQIVEGVADAQRRCANLGARVNPPGISGTSEAQGWADEDGAPAQAVRFDVAVTASEGSGTKGGIGVVAGVFTLGSAGHSKTEHAASSRVQFVVPLVLPLRGGE